MVLFYELGVVTVGPGIVGEREVDAVSDRGMTVEHEDIDRIGCGIGQIDSTEDFEGLRGNLSRIGSEAVRDLKAVLIGLMFDLAAKGVDHRIGREA